MYKSFINSDYLPHAYRQILCQKVCEIICPNKCRTIELQQCSIPYHTIRKRRQKKTVIDVDTKHKKKNTLRVAIYNFFWPVRELDSRYLFFNDFFFLFSTDLLPMCFFILLIYSFSNCEIR